MQELQHLNKYNINTNHYNINKHLNHMYSILYYALKFSKINFSLYGKLYIHISRKEKKKQNKNSMHTYIHAYILYHSSQP